MTNEKRVAKAVKYIRRLKGNERFRFLKAKDVIVRDLRQDSNSIHGCTFGFILRLQKRFSNGFTRNELYTIIKAL